MPGNRAIYDRAMDQSREASRQARWDDVLKGAVRALQEFPQETDARTLAAVALFNTGKFAQALQAFDGLRASDPNNPFYLDYIARLQEQLGEKEAAVQTYITLAPKRLRRGVPWYDCAPILMSSACGWPICSKKPRRLPLLLNT